MDVTKAFIRQVSSLILMSTYPHNCDIYAPLDMSGSGGNLRLLLRDDALGVDNDVLFGDRDTDTDARGKAHDAAVKFRHECQRAACDSPHFSATIRAWGKRVSIVKRQDSVWVGGAWKGMCGSLSEFFGLPVDAFLESDVTTPNDAEAGWCRYRLAGMCYASG